MDSTAITILTHPYQLMVMAVALYYALHSMFSGRSEGRTGRPTTVGLSEPTQRQAA